VLRPRVHSFMEREYNETSTPRDSLLVLELAGVEEELQAAAAEPPVPPHLLHVDQWRREAIHVSNPLALSPHAST
jgi:hypothetical protein